MDAFKKGDNIYRVSMMIEVIASSEREAITYADDKLVTDRIANDPRFVSFNTTIKGAHFTVETSR